MPKKEPIKKDIRSSIKAVLEDKLPVQFLLVISPDQTRRSRFTEKFIETFFGDESSGQQETRIHSSEFNSRSLGSLREAVQSLSLFSQMQAVILAEVNELKANDTKAIIEVLSATSATTSVIATASSLPVASLLYKFFDKSGVVINFEPLKGFELKRWATRECSQQGISEISEKALEMIIEMSQGDVDSLVKLIELAGLYVENGSLTEKTLSELFRISSTHSEFALVDEVFSGNQLRAKMLLGELLREGKNPFGLTAILARNFMQVLTARLEFDRGNSDSGIREILGVSPWQYNKIVGHARRVPAMKIRRMLRELLKADIRLKNRSIEIEDIFQQVIIST